MPRRIMLASPIKGGLSMEFVQYLMALTTAKIPDTEIKYQLCGGTSVALARDELANLAMQDGQDELMFMDKDLLERTVENHLNLFARILSHEVPIVAAQYCTHHIPSVFHGTRYVDENGVPAEVREDGLLQMHQMPLGFCKISCEALKTMMRATPDRTYWMRLSVGETRHLHQFFPTGIIGPNMAEGKIERIRQAVAARDRMVGINFEADQELLIALDNILLDTDYSENTMYGEDFYFCKLARDAGIPLYLDTTTIVPHESPVKLPMPADSLRAELNADWRKPAQPPTVKESGALVQGT